jgi:hypothetical protein
MSKAISARCAAIALPVIMLLSPVMVRGAGDVKMLVTYDAKENARIGLLASLENDGPKSIELYKANLPWGIRDSIVLVAVCLDGKKEVIPAVDYIDDPGPGTVSMRPGEKVSGVIGLETRFPTLSMCLKRSDAVVFWSYRLSTISANSQERLSGGVVIPKR